MAVGLQVFLESGELFFDSNSHTTVSQRLSENIAFEKDTQRTQISANTYVFKYNFNSRISNYDMKSFYTSVSSPDKSIEGYYVEGGILYVTVIDLGQYVWNNITTLTMLVKIYRI